jgi:hypothetical protein
MGIIQKCLIIVKRMDFGKGRPEEDRSASTPSTVRSQSAKDALGA